MSNTKKIFITILIVSLLLVCSSLTVFALESDFEFSAPQLNGEKPVYYFYKFENFDMYNRVPLDEYDDTFEYVGTFRRFYNDMDGPYSLNQFSLTLSQYGFEYLSQNGANVNSIHNYLEDFIEGGVGNIRCVYYYGDLISTPSIFENMESVLLDYYRNNSNLFNIDNDLNRQFFNYESQYNDILSRYNSLYTQHQDLISRYDVLNTYYQNLQTDYNNLVYENEILRDEAQLYERNLKLANDQIERLNLLVGTLESDLNNALIDVESLQHDIENYQIAISQLETIISQMEEEMKYIYNKGYTAAVDELNAFESCVYTIFSSPFVIVGNLAQIELFGTSIIKIVGIIILFVILAFVLSYVWKIIPFV